MAHLNINTIIKRAARVGEISERSMRADQLRRRSLWQAGQCQGRQRQSCSCSLSSSIAFLTARARTTTTTRTIRKFRRLHHSRRRPSCSIAFLGLLLAKKSRTTEGARARLGGEERMIRLPRFLCGQDLVRGDPSQFVDTENCVFDQVVWTRSAGGDTDDRRTDREPVFRHYFPLLMEVVVGDAVD
jgi:hypothetical protein